MLMSIFANIYCSYLVFILFQVKDVRTHQLDNRMESFFLAETTKYLYLLFTPDHFMHNSGNQGVLIDTPHGQCMIETGGYVFNTEAHPVDTSMLYCCGIDKVNDDDRLQDLYDRIDLLQLLDLVEKEYELFDVGHKKQSKRRTDKKAKTKTDSDRSKDLDNEELIKSTSANAEGLHKSDTDVYNDQCESDNNKICWLSEYEEKRQSVRRQNVTRIYGNGRILSCPVQPFHARLSLLGEMFVET